MRSKEIGSEFYDIPILDRDNLIFNDETKWFVSGRAALDFVIKDIKSKKDVKTASLPSWCCDSMIEPFIRNNIKVGFYSVIYKNNKLIKKIENVNSDILLNIDYFGYEDDNQIKFNGIIINDITHSMFVGSRECDYTIGSLRKWAGFKTGGFASCKDGFKLKQSNNVPDEYIKLRTIAMNKKTKYINNEIDTKDFLNDYSKAEEMLDGLYDYSGYIDDIQKAKKLDFISIKKKRQENAKRLLETVKEYAIFKEVKENDCPLFVPILVENRDELRKYLISKNIYCPVHWPISSLHKLIDEERYIYDHEISLVCDQRYNLEDMDYICECIKEFKC